MVRLLFLAILLLPRPSLANGCTEEAGRGLASWYGDGFHGRLTSNEDVFDPALLTAAHQTLPFGTIVKVLNLRNGKTVTVKINDRGGFGDKRVIDLSKAAAGEIGMLRDGVAPVSLFICH